MIDLSNVSKNITGEKIRQLRKERGLTQKQLGELSGIHEVQIRSYEIGKQNPKYETLQKIANALDVDVFVFYGTTKEDFKNELNKITEIAEKYFDKVKERVGIIDTNETTDEMSYEEFYSVLQYVEKMYGEKASNLLKHYSYLNESGKDKVIERAEELREIKKYTE